MQPTNCKHSGLSTPPQKRLFCQFFFCYFIKTFTKTLPCDCKLSQLNLFYEFPSLYLSSILILSFHLHRGLVSGLFPSVFPSHEALYALSAITATNNSFIPLNHSMQHNHNFKATSCLATPKHFEILLTLLVHCLLYNNSPLVVILSRINTMHAFFYGFFKNNLNFSLTYTCHNNFNS